MRRRPKFTRKRIVLGALGVAAAGLLGLAASTAYENTRPLVPGDASDRLDERWIACAQGEDCLPRRPLVIYLEPGGSGGDLLLTPPDETAPGTETEAPPTDADAIDIPMLPPEKFAGENL